MFTDLVEHPVIAKKTTAKAPSIKKTNIVAIASKISCTMLGLIGWLRFISLPFLLFDGCIIPYRCHCVNVFLIFFIHWH